MLGKIKQYKNKTVEWLGDFRDTRVIGLVLLLLIVLMVSWSSANVIGTNYNLQQQIKTLEQENRVNQLTNDNIRLQNEYYQTPQYLDIAARQHFGLASKGETVLSVPNSIALRFTVDSPDSATRPETEAKKVQPVYQQNFQSWMDFFLHRDN